MKEEEVKYLAGLMDADGSLSIKAVKSVSTGKYYAQLRLSLFASKSIDRHGYINYLGSMFGSVSETDTGFQWSVSKRTDHNMFIPRLLKHMVIKARHWKTLFDFYTETKGRELTKQELDKLRDFSDESRKNSGPLKPKNHPTKAWVAGYLDGDGCYSMRKSNKNAHIQMSIDVACHPDDRVGIDLLQKAFGGYINEMTDCNALRWKRNLGVRDSKFAIDFLRDCHRHSRLKRWKIEQMLSFHSPAATTN